MLTPDQKTVLAQALKKVSTELTLAQAQVISEQTKIPLRAVECFALEKGLVPLRYQRNIGGLGIEGQIKLLESKVIIAGLGGLGGYVLEELSRAGLSRIVGVDPDVFEETNLNRQLLSDQQNLGRNKADEASHRLKRVNTAVEFIGYRTSVDSVEDEIYRDSDLVFDCLDNIKDRLILTKRCSMANVALVHGAIAGWYGQVGVVWPGTGVLEKVYRHQTRGIEQTIGTPPFTAAAAASLMVAEGIRVLTTEDLVKEEKILFFDLLENEWQTIAF